MGGNETPYITLDPNDLFSFLKALDYLRIDPDLEFNTTLDTMDCAVVEANSPELDYYVSNMAHYALMAIEKGASAEDVKRFITPIYRAFWYAKEKGVGVRFCEGGGARRSEAEDYKRSVDLEDMKKILERFDLAGAGQFRFMMEGGNFLFASQNPESDTLVIFWPDNHGSYISQLQRLILRKEFLELQKRGRADFRLVIESDGKDPLSDKPDRLERQGKLEEIGKRAVALRERYRRDFERDNKADINVFGELFWRVAYDREFYDLVIEQTCIELDICDPNIINNNWYFSIVQKFALRVLFPDFDPQEALKLEDEGLYQQQFEGIKKGIMDGEVVDLRSKAYAKNIKAFISNAAQNGNANGKKRVYLVEQGAAHTHLFLEEFMKDNDANVIVIMPFNFARMLDQNTLFQGLPEAAGLKTQEDVLCEEESSDSSK